MNSDIIIRGLLFILSLIGVALLFKFSGLENLLNMSWVDSHIRGSDGFQGEILFIALGSLVTALGLPRHGVAFIGGYAFGLLNGAVLGLFGSLLGCILAFFYARYLGRKLISERFNNKILRLDDFLQDNTFTMTLLIRLLPLGSNLVTNLVAGVSRARALPFFGGSAIGFLPQTAIFALLGSGMNVDPLARISIAVVLFICSTLLGVYLFRKYRHGKRLDDETELALMDDSP